MVYSRFLSILSLSLFVTTSLCASGNDGAVPPLNDHSESTLQRRGSAATLEGLLASGPNAKAKQSTTQHTREEKKKGKKADPRRLSRAETGGASKLAQDAKKRRSTLSHTSASVPELNILAASDEKEREGKGEKKERRNSGSSSGSSRSPSPPYSPRDEKKNGHRFGTFFSAAKKLFEAAEEETLDEIVIGGPSINAQLTTGKAFDRHEAVKEIEILIRRVDAMDKMIGAHLKSGKQLLDPEKYEFVLKGDLGQLSQMCVQGLGYCDIEAEYKEDDANAYLQNLKRFSESVGQELLWAMGQQQDPLLDQKLKDAKEKGDGTQVSESFSGAQITHPPRRRRTLSAGGTDSQDRIVMPAVVESDQDSPTEKEAGAAEQ